MTTLTTIQSYIVMRVEVQKTVEEGQVIYTKFKESPKYTGIFKEINEQLIADGHGDKIPEKYRTL